MKNLHFERWLPPERVFLEEPTAGFSTLNAVRRAYELLGADLCGHCPRHQEAPGDKEGWSYMI